MSASPGGDLDAYGARVLELTEAMCAAARADDWACVARLSEARTELVRTAPDARSGARDPAALAAALARARDLDATLARLAHAEHAGLRERVREQRHARRAVDAYRATGG